MKTEVTDINGVKKVMKVEVLPEVVHQARSQAVQTVQKKVKIPGFRPGKVPPHVLQKQFHHEIEHQTVEKIVDLTMIPAFQEAEVSPINRPELTPGMWLPSGGYTYTLTFEVMPQFELKDYKGLKLKKEEIKVTDEELENEIKRLQTVMTQLEPLSEDTRIAKGHVVKVDFEGTIDGKPFEGGKAKDFMAEIGSGQMLAEFEKELVGAKKGELKKVSIQYPKEYFNKELAGKKGVFQVTVKDVRKKAVPELNDEFAKDLGPFKTMKEVEEDAKRRIARAKEYQQKGELQNQIIKELVDKHKFEVPRSLIHSELRYMLERFAQELKQRGQDFDSFTDEEQKKLSDDFKPQAERRVKGYLLIDKVARDLKLEVNEKEVDDRITAIAKRMERSVTEVRSHYEKNRLLGPLQSQILHEKALDIVQKEAKIKIVKPKTKKKSSK